MIPVRVSSVLRSGSSRVHFVVDKAARSFRACACGLPIPVIGGTRPFCTHTALICFPRYGHSRKISCAGARVSVRFKEIISGGKGTDVTSVSTGQRSSSKLGVVCRRSTQGVCHG